MNIEKGEIKMEKENNALVILVVILSLLVLGLSIYIVYDKVLKNNNIPIENNDFQEKDYIRQTSVVLIEEPNCTGQHSTSLKAEINSNKNIAITQDKAIEEIIIKKTKYLYKINIIACDNVKLYYITEDNGLYVIEQPSTEKTNQTGTKVTSSKIIEFLGEEHRDDGSYLKVLTEGKNIEYIKYFTTPDYSS